MAKKKHEGGFMDHLLHGDHGHASESEEAEVENDLPIVSKPKSKKNSDEGASSESKHHHKKMDKFKKGNS
jgi:hypothetical protein